MSEGIDINESPRIRRASNRIGMRELDEEDGWVFLSLGAYTCRGSTSEIEEEIDETDI